MNSKNDSVGSTADALLMAEEALVRLMQTAQPKNSKSLLFALAVYGDALIAHHKACEDEARRQSIAASGDARPARLGRLPVQS